MFFHHVGYGGLDNLFTYLLPEWIRANLCQSVRMEFSLDTDPHESEGRSISGGTIHNIMFPGSRVDPKVHSPLRSKTRPGRPDPDPEKIRLGIMVHMASSSGWLSGPRLAYAPLLH